MNPFNLKIRQIFVPFLILFHGALICFTGIDWWLNSYIENPLRELWLYCISGFISIALIVLFLKQRLIVLEEDMSKDGNKNSGYVSFYSIFIIGIMFLSMRIDVYLGDEIGKSAEVNRVSEISKKKPARFYFLKHCYPERDMMGCDSVLMSNKVGDDIMLFRVSCPLLDKDSDTYIASPSVWIAYEYEVRVKKSESKEEWTRNIKMLSQVVRAKFKLAPLDSFLAFNYLERAREDMAYQSYVKAARRSYAYEELSSILIDPIILKPIYVPFEKRSSGNIIWIIGGYSCLIILFALNLLITKLK